MAVQPAAPPAIEVHSTASDEDDVEDVEYASDTSVSAVEAEQVDPGLQPPADPSQALSVTTAEDILIFFTRGNRNDMRTRTVCRLCE